MKNTVFPMKSGGFPFVENAFAKLARRNYFIVATRFHACTLTQRAIGGWLGGVGGRRKGKGEGGRISKNILLHLHTENGTVLRESGGFIINDKKIYILQT